jgi:eukaryotic-like serine/threonine-protein kinase
MSGMGPPRETVADALSSAPAVALEDRAFRIGRYETRGEIGRGTMGIVYEAYDPSLHRSIALKTFHLSFAVSPQQYKSFEQRFFAEARIAARLSHPGIVAVHDVGSDPDIGTLYIALEYVRGRTLQDVIKGGVPLEWREALRITCRIAEALHYAHSEGVVHRDIKPANIMLLPSGEPKVLDFGIAKMETNRKLTTCQVFGTPLFMAPEQALGHKPDGRADLFSLGSMAYTLLTGHLAFEAPSIPATVRRLIEDDPVAPSKLVPDLPPGIDPIMARLLAKKPDQRYLSGQELVEDLQALLGQGAAPIASSPLDLEAELEALVPNPGASGDPVGTLRRGGIRWRLHWMSSALLAVLTVGYLALRLPPAASEGPTEPVPGAAAPATLPEPPGRTPVAPGGREVPSIAVPATVMVLASKREPRRREVPALVAAVVPVVEPARLRIDFEHSLTSGMLRIWVDGQMALQQELESRGSTGIPGLKLRKGRFDQEIAVPPGEHTVRVQVHWDDNEREESLSSHFSAGTARLLEVNLGRLRKNLSVEWK